MIRPPRLRPGDAIAIVAPSGPVPEARFDKGRALLAARYDLRYTRRLFAEDGYLAGDDDARHAELHAAFTDDTIRAIVCARGGYGVMRLLSRLPAAWLRDHAKPVVGFSDVTALHAQLLAAGMTSVHGPVVTQLGELPDEDARTLFALLEGAVGEPLTGLRSLTKAEVAEGALVGGNLELVTRLLGTPHEYALDGAVLLLEEVGERPYRLDRSLTQLRLAGAFERVAAVVVGELVRCEEAGGPLAAAVLEERLRDLHVPVLTGLPVGHGTRNHALGHGARVRVDGKAGTLTPLEAPFV